MNKLLLVRMRTLLFLCLLCAATGPTLYAQLQIERELVGAVVTVSSADESDQSLQVDASFGEPLIGFIGGDILATVGFHQPSFLTEGSGNLGDLSAEAPEAFNVRAFPNPAIQRLTVDLAEVQDDLFLVRIVDMNGRSVKQRVVTEQRMVEFDQLSNLPTATYYLQGFDRMGRAHALGSIMIITH